MAAYNLFIDEIIAVQDPTVLLSLPNAYVVANADGVTTTAYIGENLTFDGVTGLPNGGTLTSVIIGAIADGTPLLTITDLKISLTDYFAEIALVNDLRSQISWFGVIDQDAEPTEFTDTHIVIENTDGTFTEIVGADLADVNGAFLGTVDLIRLLDTDGISELGVLDPVSGISLEQTAAILFDLNASEFAWDLLNSGDNTVTGLNNSDLLGNTYFFKVFDSAGSDVLIGALPQQFISFELSSDAIAYVATIGLAFHANGDVDQVVGSNSVFGSDFNDALNGQNMTTSLVFLGGAGDDFIFGGNAGDFIDGDAGSDFLDGGAGVDTLRFLNIESTGFSSSGYEVVVDLSTGESYQYGDSGGTPTEIDTLQNFENVIGSDLADSITGSSAANRLEGGLGADALAGLEGADTLDGGAGADLLFGGAGNDIYLVTTGDVLNESVGGGVDEARASANYTLNDSAGAYVERLVAAATGITLTGNIYNNTLVGNSSSTLQGGLGSDTYVLSAAGDTVVENADAGGDQVQAAFTYTLGANLESLTLTGAAAINGTGNTLNNVISGNAAVNTLTGLGGNDTLIGGAGADAMNGGGGSDTYFVDDVGDTITDSSGTDTVNSFITFTLAAGLERLILNGVNAINGTGNAGANTITGNLAANTLSGAGGVDTLSGLGGDDVLNGGGGADSMSGGAGNDTYIVDNAGDVTTELANTNGGGIDTVQSSITRNLGAHIENLTLTGAAAINGTGNALNNIMTGNNAANVLAGAQGADELRGGLGNDTLTGGAGADKFVFDTAPNTTTNTDSITDFAAVDDVIWLNNAVFTAFAADGAILTGNLRQGAGVNAAVDANDFLIYNSTTGQLRYDADGSGAGAAVLIATLTGAPALTSADFLII